MPNAQLLTGDTTTGQPAPGIASLDDTIPVKSSVLIVDDEPAVRTILSAQLDHEFDVRSVGTIEQARADLAAHPIDILLTDQTLPDGTGLQLLDWAQHHCPRTARILMTGTSRVEDIADAVNCTRVQRLVLKPLRAADLITTLNSVASHLRLERNHQRLFEEYRQLNQDLEKRVNDRTRELKHALHQLQMKNQILEKMALTDPLTGLPNRRAIELIARKELLRRTRTPAYIAFGLVDADRFKEINSRYLLSGGDQVLIWLGQTLAGTMRATDALGRVGGEEFMVVAPGTDADGAKILAERLRATVAAGHTVYRDEPIRMTISVGFAVAGPDVTVGYDQLREQAAAALAAAKAGGRNRCVIRRVEAAGS